MTSVHNLISITLAVSDIFYRPKKFKMGVGHIT